MRPRPFELHEIGRAREQAEALFRRSSSPTGSRSPPGTERANSAASGIGSTTATDDGSGPGGTNHEHPENAATRDACEA